MLFIPPKNTHPELAETSLPWKTMTHHPCAHFHYRDQLKDSSVQLHRQLIIKTWENCTFPMSREHWFFISAPGELQTHVFTIDFTLNIDSGQGTQCVGSMLNISWNSLENTSPHLWVQDSVHVQGAGECGHSLHALMWQINWKHEISPYLTEMYTPMKTKSNIVFNLGRMKKPTAIGTGCL